MTPIIHTCMDFTMKLLARLKEGTHAYFAIRRHSGIIDYGIVLLVSLVSAYLIFITVDHPAYAAREELHKHIVGGPAPSPYRYRLLVPHLVELAIRMASAYTSPKWAFLLSYFIYDLVAFVVLFGSLLWYLRGWFDRLASLLGVLLVASTIPVVVRDQYFQPWSYLDAGVFVIALGLIRKGRALLLAVVTVIATLNRETAIFIPFAFLIANFGVLRKTLDGSIVRCPTVARLVVLTLCWALVYGGVRLAEGDAPRVITVPEMWTLNIKPENLLRTLTQHCFFGVLLYPLALLGYRRAPRFARELTIIIPFYMALLALFSLWWEVRLLMPLYPILLPLALSAVFPVRPGLDLTLSNAPGFPATHRADSRDERNML